MRLPRFILVGALCAGLSNLLIISFILLGVHYAVATLIAFGPVLVVGYCLHAAVTFDAPMSWASFRRYALGMAANYPIWLAALYLFCDLLALPAPIATPLATVLVVVWNYACARWALLGPAALTRASSSSRGPI